MQLKLRPNQMEEIEGLQTEYPYAYHHVDLTETVIPWHWHEALEFIYVLQGTMQVSTTSRSLSFRDGEGFFVNSNVLATMESTDNCIVASHLFHPVLLTGHFKSVFETKYLEPVIHNRQIDIVPFYESEPQQDALLQKLRQLTMQQVQPDSEFQTRNLLSEIWLLLLSVLQDYEGSSPVSLSKQQRLQTMMAFIQENYKAKLTLEQIADVAAISVRECLRCFQTSIHCSPIDYLVEHRVQVARQLLENTHLSVAAVAREAGFSSCAYFSKVFKRSTGLTPSEYHTVKMKKA